MERKRNATNFVGVVSMMEFDRWTEASSIGLVCPDKGESPDIGRTVECLPTLASDNKISLRYLIPASSALWTEVDGGGGGGERGGRTDRGRG